MSRRRPLPPRRHLRSPAVTARRPPSPPIDRRHLPSTAVTSRRPPPPGMKKPRQKPGLGITNIYGKYNQLWYDANSISSRSTPPLRAMDFRCAISFRFSYLLRTRNTHFCLASSPLTTPIMPPTATAMKTTILFLTPFITAQFMLNPSTLKTIIVSQKLYQILKKTYPVRSIFLTVGPAVELQRLINNHFTFWLAPKPDYIRKNYFVGCLIPYLSCLPGLTRITVGKSGSQWE